MKAYRGIAVLMGLLGVSVISACSGGSSSSDQDAGQIQEGVSPDGGTPAAEDAGPMTPEVDAGPAGPTFEPQIPRGEVPCWAFDPDVIFAVPVTFDESSPTWTRPTYNTDDPTCPATEYEESPVPVEVHAYCNTTASPMIVGVELLTDEDSSDALDDPLLYIYWGEAIAEDALQCAAVNDDVGGFGIFKTSEVRDIELMPGSAITVVATVPRFDANAGEGVGEFQVVSGPQELLDEGVEEDE